MVGNSGFAGDAGRRLDQRRAGALFRSALRGAKRGQGSGPRALDEFAVGALMYEDAAPIAQAAASFLLARLSFRGAQQRCGALSHAAGAMGDVAFKGALRDFYFKFAERSARIDDFESIAERRVQATAAAAKPPQDPPNCVASSPNG